MIDEQCSKLSAYGNNCINLNRKNLIFCVTKIQCSGSGSICFWAPGSVSIIQRYGSGSFYQQAKIVSKTLIPTVL
jgi:hypothetical protein